MITRLKVTGFKNLADTDVQFGPFTCIAGPNGVGKSNLFDAITFLSSLSSCTLVEAARQVRDPRTRSTDVRSLFFESELTCNPVMSFAVEMLIPRHGVDEFGQSVKASITFLWYSVRLRLVEDKANPAGFRLSLDTEELRHFNQREAHSHIWFQHSADFRKTAVSGVRRGGPFISTERGKIKLHQDGQSGNPRHFSTETLARTVLSGVNSMEHPTALMARREMQSWRMLQLEPSSLRQPDNLSSPIHVGSDGAHGPATLHHLISQVSTDRDGASIRAAIADRLHELNENVRDVDVELDQPRELLTLNVTDRNGAKHAARALSDGTLRFLTLAIIEQDPDATGLICFEEPENGIHPARIESILNLLRALCVNPMEAIDEDNLLRQVIINTHSPSVVAKVQANELLVAEQVDFNSPTPRSAVRFAFLPKSLRHTLNPKEPPTSLGRLYQYLSLNSAAMPDVSSEEQTTVKGAVIHQLRQQQFLFDSPK